MTSAILQLEGLPLAGGGFRAIFQHPERDHLLVKVIRPDAAEAAGPHIFASLRRYGAYGPYVREIREYLALRSRFPECPDIVQKCYGFADTNRGLGMVVEKIVGRDNKLAPNVAAIARTCGVTSRLWESCERFFDEVRRHNLVVGDLNPRNIVVGADGDRDRLVLVDGLGEKAFVPLRSMSHTFNRFQLERGIRRCKLRILQYAAGLYRPGRISFTMARKLRLANLIDRPPAGRGT